MYCREGIASGLNHGVEVIKPEVLLLREPIQRLIREHGWWQRVVASLPGVDFTVPLQTRGEFFAMMEAL
jgi:hypothetical protein